MKHKRSSNRNRKSSAAKPIPIASPIQSQSPNLFKFTSNFFTTPPNKNNNNNTKTEAMTSASPKMSKTSVRITDLKETTSVHIDSIKRQVECCYSDLLKDMDVSHSKLQKRFKVQNQACEQSMVEAEKDFNMLIDHISETHDTMEASYTDLIAQAQTRATHLCKTIIPELKQSVEKAIDALRSHYKVAT